MTWQEEGYGIEIPNRRLAVTREGDRRVLATRWSSRVPSCPSTWGRVRACGALENLEKMLEKLEKIFYGRLCNPFWIWHSQCLDFSTDQPRFA